MSLLQNRLFRTMLREDHQDYTIIQTPSQCDAFGSRIMPARQYLHYDLATCDLIHDYILAGAQCIRSSSQSRQFQLSVLKRVSEPEQHCCDCCAVCISRNETLTTMMRRAECTTESSTTTPCHNPAGTRMAPRQRHCRSYPDKGCTSLSGTSLDPAERNR